jgi:hypothetical protein
MTAVAPPKSPMYIRTIVPHTNAWSFGPMGARRSHARAMSAVRARVSRPRPTKNLELPAASSRRASPMSSRAASPRAMSQATMHIAGCPAMPQAIDESTSICAARLGDRSETVSALSNSRRTPSLVEPA